MEPLKICYSDSSSLKSSLAAIKICCECAGLDSKQQKSNCSSAIPNKQPILCMDKHNVSGTRAIMRTIARMRPDSGLYGDSFSEHALVDQWMDYMNAGVIVPLMRMLSGPLQSDDENKVKKVLSVINKHLLANTFMVGNCITIADIYLVVGLCQLKSKYGEMLRNQTSINRLFDTCVNQKQFKNCCIVEEDDAPPPKKSNPLDSLPPPTMNLDEWKRTYSNTKDLYNVAMPWFWKNFDKKDYSLWYMKYDKTPTECKVAFLTSNLLGGFLQRIDPNFRKYSFAVNNITEEKDCTEDNKKFDIVGVWLFRGTEIPKEMLDHPSFEYFNFTKLDSDKADVRTLVNDYWCADSIVEGLSIADCKVWK